MPPSERVPLIGYIKRQTHRISMDEWIAFASLHPNLIQVVPRTIINPFTRKPAQVKARYSFYVRDRDADVGLMMWQESETVVAPGAHEVVRQVIADACIALQAEFFPLDS